MYARMASDPTRPAPRLAFEHLNLRRNPFGEPERSERGGLADTEPAAVERWVTRLAGPGFALQFLGDSGRGKTTHLLALHRHFPDVPFLYIAEGMRPKLPQGTPLFVDEVQRLGRLRRSRLFRSSRSFAVGTHLDLSAEFRAAGLEVETVVPARALTPDKLKRMFERRVHWARRRPGPVPRISERTVRALIAAHGSNVRAMERDLYAAFQRAQEIEYVEV